MWALSESHLQVVRRDAHRERDPAWVAPDLAMMKFLLDAGGDMGVVDNQGRTLRDRAEEIGDTAVLALLGKCGMGN